MSEATKALLAPIEIIQRMNTGYCKYLVEDRWGEIGNPYRGLAFTPSGLMRLGQVTGFICGLYTAAQNTKNEALAKMGEGMAEDLLKQLDFLAGYGGWANEQQKVPACIVELTDDGTFMGWSLKWYNAVRYDDLDAASRAVADKKAYKRPGEPKMYLEPRNPYGSQHQFIYVYGFNGGCLYSGPGAQEIFSCNLTQPKFWSIHT